MSNAERTKWNGGSSTANGSVSLAEYCSTQNEIAEYEAQQRATFEAYEAKRIAAQRAAQSRGRK